MTVLEFLTTHGLGEHATLFAEHEVDLATLRILTDADLKELGLPFGPRKRLLNAIGGLQAPPPASAPGTEPSPAPGRASAAAGDDGERRQLTVMFCDMVGFTELAGRVDPEVLQDVIRKYEDTCAACITRYEGYVFQRLGDGIVAFFGFPLAHEGEAERALRAGLEIIEVLARTAVPEVGHLQVRIGVAAGVVVVSARERSAVGETMNLAARLQSIAEPGSLVVSENVHRLAGGVFKYEDLGERQLKGIAKRSRPYKVVGVRDVVSRFDATTLSGVAPLVGREQELGQLFANWETAQRGQGRMVMLNGEAGIGKSHMLSALRGRLEAMGAGILRFQCSPFHVNSALQPSVDALARSLRFGRDEPPESKLDKVDALIRRLGLPPEDARFVADVLALPSAERYGPIAISARRLKEESLRTLLDLIDAAARRRPSLLLFEDAHWADPSSLELLQGLIARLRDIPLLVVLTHRPEFRAPWPPAPHVTAVELSRLKGDESRAIIQRVAAGKALPARLIDEIVAKADGVPLFVEEVTKSMLESGELTEEPDRYVYTGSATSIAVPSTLRDSLMARLDRVTAVKEIAQIGATIGREFSYELLAAVSPMGRSALDEGLERLTESGLAFRRGRIPDATYTFKHALVQDAAYDSLLKSRRQVLHLAIAEVLAERDPGTAESAPESLARHYTAAGLDEQAIRHWRRAAEAALERSTLPEAIAHLRSGLACAERLPSGPARDLAELTLRTLLGPALLAHRGWAYAEVSTTLEPAWALAKSLEHADSYLPILHCLWVHHMSGCRLTTSIEWAERMLELALRTHDEGLEIAARRAAMTSSFWTGDLLRARREGDVVVAMYDAERHGRIAQRTNSDPLTGDGIYRAHYLWMLGYPDQARAVQQATLDHARRRSHPFDVAFVLTLGSQVFEYCGEPEPLLRCADEAERVGREFGVPLMSEIMADISVGEGWLLEGRVAESVAHLREATRRLNGTGHRVWVAYLEARLGEAVARSGDFAGGLAIVEASLAREECREDRVHLAEILRLQGWMLMELGRLDEAERALRTALDVARAQQARSWELRASTTMARLLAGRGDVDAARALLAPIHAWFTEGFDTRDLQDATRLLGQLAG